MIFFAVAKVVLFALFIAAIMSLIYFGLKTLAGFFGKMAWAQDERSRSQYYLERDHDFRRGYRDFDFNFPQTKWDKERIIQIR